ncbi:MAG: glycosyltransferase family protein [Ignavibacteria bacterium]|nr:glycosyltransferase family protein [Ignavibacteria bacterium]
MNIVIVVQARTSSSRLPNKIFLPLSGEPLLVRMMERILAAKTAATVVVATSTEEDDDAVEELCEDYGYNCFRGSLENLLERHYLVGLEYKADVVVKIPSDCPLIDPAIIDKVINFYIQNKDKFDYVSNLHPPTYPDGNDVEVIPMPILKITYENALMNMELEHTTPYIWERPDEFRIGNVQWETGLDYSMTYRFTIDYKEDYEFIKTVYDELYEKNNLFGLDDILKLLEEKPEIKKINEKYLGVNWYRNHLDDLKTISPEDTRLI